MSEEAAYLAAIRKTPRDDSLRLIYADWLEERDSRRATYLRVETELRQTWTYENSRRDLVGEMKKLRPKMDIEWLAQVRLCTTPPPPFDVEKVVPGLKGKSKPAFLLHIRPGTAPQEASKVGGLFLWPEKEPWPTCAEHGNCPLVPALQLRKQDVPRITKFKGTSDLLQVLWCPHNHEPSYCVEPKIYWRRAKSVKVPAKEHPEPTSGEDWYMPKPCVVIPERVREYPDPLELDGDIYALIESGPEFLKAAENFPLKREKYWSIVRDEDAYQWYLSTSECTKVGGYPDWVQDPWYPDCSECKKPMENLLSFGSLEFDGTTWARWLPIEERDILTARYDLREAVECAPDWVFGDAGQVYVFICRNCPDWPIQSSMQCS